MLKLGVMNLKKFPNYQKKINKIKSELLKFAKDHYKHFKFYPIEFEYENQIYDQDFILKTIKEGERKKWPMNKEP